MAIEDDPVPVPGPNAPRKATRRPPRPGGDPGAELKDPYAGDGALKDPFE
jgi:hypothetical protein